MLVGTAGNVKVVFCGSARKRKQAGTVMIYMDNAATTMRKPKEVIEAVANAMQCMGNAGRGAHEASLDASRVIYDTRERLAKLFGAESPKSIVFTNNSGTNVPPFTPDCQESNFFFSILFALNHSIFLLFYLRI